MTRTTTLGIVALALTLAGCTAETGPEPKPVVASAPNGKETAPSPETTTQPKRGSTMFVAALEEPIGLTPDQRKTIEGLLASLPDTPSATGSAIAVVAHSTETDEARLEAMMSAALHDAVEPLVKPTAELHAALTKDQRLALVTALSSRPPKHELIVSKHKAVAASPKMLAQQPTAGSPDGNDRTEEQPAQPPVDLAAVREKILVQHRARLDRFAADDFDARMFVTPQVDLKPLAAKLARIPADSRPQLFTKVIARKPAVPATKAP